ncbi:organic solvent tolerance protein OstA [Bacillus sp. JJ722]|uniref:organic solvent tolerance protein OstA n=1 Tax=Bacillus sp. JJ722 TaxID=3122973 RepID=UPI0030000389
MAVKELSTKEQHYADTREEAEEIVTEAKEDVYLTSFKISEKHNKYGTYFLVDLAFSYNTPREIMETATSKPVDEENTDPPHEGVPYTVEDGVVSINNNQEDDE